MKITCMFGSHNLFIDNGLKASISGMCMYLDVCMCVYMCLCVRVNVSALSFVSIGFPTSIISVLFLHEFFMSVAFIDSMRTHSIILVGATKKSHSFVV